MSLGCGLCHDVRRVLFHLCDCKDNGECRKGDSGKGVGIHADTDVRRKDWEQGDAAERELMYKAYILINYLINLKGEFDLPRTERVNQQIREDTTEKILEAAKEVFARKGMAAKMAEVAAAAGVSVGLAYHYFPSKEAIFVALVRQMIVPADEIRERAQKIPGSPSDRLGQMVSTMVKRRREDPGFYQFLRQALSNDMLPPDLREALLSQALVVHDVIRQLITEGQTTGEIANDNPDKLARAILACLDGLSGMPPSSPERIKDEMPDANIILRMLKPDRHPR